MTVNTGARLELYVKVRFTRDLQAPIIGLRFTNKEGVLVYGVNNAMLNAPIEAVNAGDLCNFRFEVEAELSPGDWFIDFAVAESTTDLCDSRASLVHLQFLDTKSYIGFVRLDTAFGLAG